jgi:acetylornithine/N-succinyldiaminopimelate aminotransferase
MKDFTMDTYNRTGLVLAEGKGARVRSTDGREFVDFTAGIGVSSLGHGNEALVSAIASQAARLIHVSNYYQSEPALEAAAALCASSGMDRVFFCNSGCEALEGAIKIARKRGNSMNPARNVIVTLESSFHGRTITDLAATGQEKLHRDFGPFTPGFRYVAAGDKAALDAALGGDVCAFLFEPIQGEGGVYPLDPGYLRYAADLCKERGILLMADEVQCGVGRSGSFLASALAGIRPDVVALAKGLAGGVPIGAVLGRGEAATVLGRGDHGSTFGGGPLATAAACVVLKTLDEPGFLEGVAQKGERIMGEIRSWKHPLVKEVRGRGLMIGVVLTVPPDEVKHAAIDQGLLVLTAGEDVLRLLPPLVISDADIDAGLGRLKASLDQAGRGRAARK